MLCYLYNSTLGFPVYIPLIQMLYNSPDSSPILSDGITDQMIYNLFDLNLCLNFQNMLVLHNPAMMDAAIGTKPTDKYESLVL